MKFKSKGLILLYVIFIIIVIFVFYLEFSKDDNEDSKEKRRGPCLPIIDNVPVSYNNLSKSYEFIIGPIKNQEGKPMKNVNISLEFNGTIYSNLTNIMGNAKIIIPENSISIEEFNKNKNVIGKLGGYYDIEFKIYLQYS